jgi:hypothetical protein
METASKCARETNFYLQLPNTMSPKFFVFSAACALLFLCAVFLWACHRTDLRLAAEAKAASVPTNKTPADTMYNDRPQTIALMEAV